MIKTLSTLVVISFLSISCIQIPIGNTETESYKKIRLKAPNGFNSLKALGSDQAWIKNSSGNIISYRTECPSQVKSVEDHFNNISSDFLNSKIISQKKFQYNNRTAVRYNFIGDIESITTNFDLVGFKKYGCFFIITHNGKKDALEKTENEFESFLENFKVLQ